MEDNQTKSELYNIGQTVLKTYYTEFGHACCFMPRVFIVKDACPVGEASGAMGVPELGSEKMQSEQQQQTNQFMMKELSNQKDTTEESDVLQSSKKFDDLPSTRPKDKVVSIYPSDQSSDNHKQTPTTSMASKREEEAPEKKTKAVRKERFEKKEQNRKLGILPPTVAVGDKGTDGEQKVFANLQQKMQDGFVFSGFKYDSAKHKILQDLDPTMAEIITDKFSATKPKATKKFEQSTDDMPSLTKDSKASKNFRIPTLEVDFIIFHFTKGLFIGEAKSGQNTNVKSFITKAKQQLEQINALMTAIAKRCGEDNLTAKKVIFLPLQKEDAEEKNTQNDKGFLFVRGNPDWWQKQSEIHSNLSKNILYSLIAMYVKLQLKESDLGNNIDMAQITRRYGDSMNTHLFLNSKNCLKYQLDKQYFNGTKFFLNPEQNEVFENKSKRLVIAGPAGSGKSLILKYKAFDLAWKGEKVVFVAPVGLHQKYVSEKELYGDNLSNLWLLNASNLKDKTTLREMFDGGYHVFIDEVFCWIDFLKIVFPVTIIAASLYFWMAGDILQIYRNFDNSSGHQILLSNRLFNLRILTTTMRCTPELMKHWSSYYSESISCGNRLFGSGVTPYNNQSYYSEKADKEFVDFFVEKATLFLDPLRSLDSEEEIAVICETLDNPVIAKLQESEWRRNCGFNVQFYHINQVASMEWNTVIVVELVYSMYLRKCSSTRYFSYMSRSRAKVNLLILQELGDGPTDVCSTSKCIDFLESSVKMADQRFINSKYTDFFWMSSFANKHLREILMVEIEKFFCLESPLIGQEMRRIFPKGESELKSLPWSLLSMAESHVAKMFDNAADNDVVNPIVDGFLKTQGCKLALKIATNSELDFASLLVDTNLMEDANVTRQLVQLCNKDSVISLKAECRRSFASAYTVGVLEDLYVSDELFQESVEKASDQFQLLETKRPATIDQYFQYCNNVLKLLSESFNQTELIDGFSELILFIRNRLENSSLWDILQVFSKLKGNGQTILLKASFDIIHCYLNLLLASASAILDYNPWLNCDSVFPSISTCERWLIKANVTTQRSEIE